MEQENTNNIEQKEEHKESKKGGINTPAAIVTAAIIIALAILFTRGEAPKKTDPSKNMAQNAGIQVQEPVKKISVRPSDAVRGDVATSDVVIIEYSDSDCPFCERFHNTMKELIQDNDIKVAWVYRHFPLAIHPNAKNEAVALECVKSLGGNNAFWNYLDTVIGITVSPSNSAKMLGDLAVKENIDYSKFTKCIASSESTNLVDEQSKEAQSLGARGTPFSVAINVKTNKQLTIPGALPIEQTKELLKELLK